VVLLMNRVGAHQADFIVMQTSDRDAGCYEVRAPECGNPFGSTYWTASDYDTHFATARTFHEGIGNLPLLWWQTPMGVPAASSGSPGRYRDNHVDTFLRNAEILIGVGGIGVVFSGGAENQTTIRTDGGHFRERLNAYLADPTPLE
jgi:hypothetical protein